MKIISLAHLADKWPSSIVAREQVGTFTGGLISPKSLANLDSQKVGPLGAIRIGKKVAYPVASFIEWLESRSSHRAAPTDTEG